MEFFCGLDVSMDETAVCVVDGEGAVHLEVAVVTDAGTILKTLKPFLGRLRRVGHEAGSLSPWLHPELKKLGLPAICLETVHVRAACAAQRNKTDKADALGIAHLMRTGWFRQAYIKSESCYRTKLLLTHRRNLKAKFLDLENAIRHSLKSFGIRLNKVGRAAFEQAMRTAVADDPLSAELMDAMLTARGAVETVLPAARCRRQDRRPQRDLPALHGHPRRRPGDSAVVHDRDRRSVALPPLARRRGLLRADVAALAVRLHDRRPGTHLEGRRRGCAARALRGGVRPDDALQGCRQGQELGPGDRQAFVPPQGLCRCSAQAGGDHACPCGATERSMSAMLLQARRMPAGARTTRPASCWGAHR